MTDKIISISAMITAIIAVVIGVVELQTNREFQRLSVQPYLELSNSNRNGYERILINTGLGPAKIVTVDVDIDGDKITNWKEAIAKITGDDQSPITYSGIWKGRQVRAGELITLLQISKKETAERFFMDSSKVKINLCYCSIYNDCWLKQNRREPTAIDNCPINGGTKFPTH